jgi:hypothetical protein
MILDLFELAVDWPFLWMQRSSLYGHCNGSGNFSYENTTERTFWRRRNSLPVVFFRRRSANVSIRVIRKKGCGFGVLALSRFVSFANGQVACKFLVDEDFSRAAVKGQFGGLVNELFRIRM